MKIRVFFQGSLVCVVIWALVLAAQGYFRSLRSTAENLGKVVENEEFADWTASKGEPGGEERQPRDRRIREVVSLLAGQEFNPETRMRLSELKDQFYSRLSPGERKLFVNLLLEQIDPYIVLFDALPVERRRKLIKRSVRVAREELPPELLGSYEILNAGEEQKRIGEAGWRRAMKGKSPDQIMEYLQLIEIAGELIQRLRIPKWEGQIRDE
ncbi:MAG: hypothetical protein QF405_11295 [Roseibacillus sp.]|jgi:hypothetical protein|nr:hypothetical protein [Roseibacillus sp.]MCP4729035.1 hypothetical protein [Roseibacillus sp.]MDP6207188.1 hypothetical protein [Roseibacillus sp.]MDP7308213.1 hypothetical protein [Roseibacillus sp.]MDP7495637.1 hypothetical protein [Roseibacillus sp.]|tara:strand:+ start:10911 stop:11546 length:636 start_codon:yes stop_codon:yes gene_type:complete